MTAALATILDELGVVVIPTTKRREPGETCAVGTLHKILRERGGEHLRQVLMTLMETTNHRGELTSPVIAAFSDILNANPSWFCGSKWFDVVDDIDVAGIRAKAKKMRGVTPSRQAVATMLLTQLHEHFHPDRQMELFK